MSLPSFRQRVHSNISATTSAFQLGEGIYVARAHATWSAGNIQLQTMAADNVTWVNVGSSITADTVTSPMYLPWGSYRWQVTTATGVYVDLDEISLQTSY